MMTFLNKDRGLFSSVAVDKLVSWANISVEINHFVGCTSDDNLYLLVEECGTHEIFTGHPNVGDDRSEV